MRTFRTLLVAGAAALAALVLPRCAGCSEECSGDNQGGETCPCASDQDCTTRLGTVLLCVEGACAVGDPPAAPAELGECVDGQCGEGLGCGIDDVCFAAPRCQRIDVPLRYRLADGSTGDVVTVRDDCTHTWSADAGADGEMSATFIIDIEGNLAVEGCDQGHWFAADRLGELVCDGVRWAVAPADVTTCVLGECDDGCTRVGEAVGVCP